jgi:hypothetical protein
MKQHSKSRLVLFIDKWGSILTIIALILAIITEIGVQKINSSASKQSKSINTQYVMLDSISKSLSTQYVGNFPQNMTEIIKLINNTKNSLIVICDVPAYGHFSNPPGYANYNIAFRNIMTQQYKPKVTYLTYDAKRRIQHSFDQFPKSYNEIKNSSGFKRYCDNFKTSSTFALPKDETKEGLFRWLDATHVDFQNQMKNLGVEVLEDSTDLRAFMWISDDKTAIFSFYNYGSDSREVSFKTNDKALIDILKDIAKASFKKNENN